MHIRGRFRPHPRGFGFLHVVTDDGHTAASVTVPRDNGAAVTADRIFVPPPVARGLIADDLVEADIAADDKGVTATTARAVEQPRRMLVGAVTHGAGRLVMEPDSALGSGWIHLDASVEQQVSQAVGRIIVVLRADDGSRPSGRALVAGPFVAGSPQAIRAIATVVTLDRVAPQLVPGGAHGAQLDDSAAAMTHTRLVGLLAGGARGGAAGLDTTGAIPGAAIEPVDRTDEWCVTIDDRHARDLDDAFHATWDGADDSLVQVAIHIADAAGAVGIHSAADMYARTVAATAYLAVGSNAPMLDPQLSEDALSLLSNVERRVLSVRFGVDPRGEIVQSNVELATIRSRAQLSYAAVEQWLAGDHAELANEVSDDLVTIDSLLTAGAEASRRLGVARDARGTFEALFADAAWVPTLVDGRLAVADAEPHVNAYRMIERLMVAANETVAQTLADANIPALYRAHAGLDAERLERLQAAAELAGVDLVVDDDTDVGELSEQLLAAIDAAGEEGRASDRDLLIAAVTATTARANYDTDPAHHRGLAAAAYTHFTSPLRRYADLVVHRQLRAHLAGETPPYDSATLAALAPWLDARAGALQHLERRERGDLWAQLLDRGFLTDPEPATVTGLTTNGIRIRLPRLGLSGFVTAERALGMPSGQRGHLVVDDHGLTTTSGPWRVGATVTVRFVGLDDTARPIWRLATEDS